MSNTPKLRPDWLLEFFKENLEEDEGKIYWKVSSPFRDMNKPLGNLTHKGYLEKAFFKGDKSVAVKIHHLVWFLTKGYWPTLQIDHINGIKTDNRIENLRQVTNKQNSWNQTSVKGTSSVYKGVTWNKRLRKWNAQIKVNGKLIHLGTFDKEWEAAWDYNMKAIELFGEFAKLNTRVN